MTKEKPEIMFRRQRLRRRKALQRAAKVELQLERRLRREALLLDVHHREVRRVAQHVCRQRENLVEL